MPHRTFRPLSILACAALAAGIALPQATAPPDRGAERIKYVPPIYPEDPEKKDPQGNVVVGPALLHDCQDCVVWSDGDPIVLFGVQEMVVVHANGRTLVMPAERAASMKQLLDALPPAIRDIGP